MATNFPTSLDTLTNPAAGNPLNSPSHADQHANVNDAIEALQAKVGIDGSADTNSLDYKINNIGGGGITWSEVTATSQSANVDTGYIANNASLVTITLPNTAAVGSVLRVAGKGSGGWRVAQNASEIIRFGNVSTTTGTSGYIESTQTYDAVELVCIVANTQWVVISSIGNITIN